MVVNNLILGNLIIFLHGFFGILFGLIIIFTNNIKVLYFTLFWAIIKLISFYINNGCILTKLEIYLTKNNYTVMDPILNIIGMNITNKNRYNLTHLFILLTIIVIICKIIIYQVIS